MSHLIVKELMKDRPKALLPEASLLKVVEMFAQTNNEIPIVGPEGNVLGLVTENDLTLQGSLHLPTFLRLFREFRVYGQDQDEMKDYMNKIFDLKAKDAMSTNFLSISEHDPADNALKMFNENPGVNTIVVLDDFKHLAGTLSRREFIKLLGSPMSGLLSNKNLDKEIGSMLKNFEKEFVMVTKFRSHYWVFLSILFAVIGFIIAFALIVRVRF